MSWSPCAEFGNGGAIPPHRRQRHRMSGRRGYSAAFLQTPLALPTRAVDPPSSHSHIRIII